MAFLLAITIILHLNIGLCSGEGGDGGVDYWVGTMPPPGATTTPTPAQHSCDICIVGRRINHSLCRKCVTGKYLKSVENST